MVKLIDLGYSVAKLEDRGQGFVDLYIMTRSDKTEGDFMPAESVSINGVENLKTLQAALNDFFHNREDE